MAVVSHDPLHHCSNYELLTPICKLGVTQIEKIKKEVALQAKDQAEESQSVFHSLLRSDMPPAELSDMRLSADAMALLAAGTATTSSVLTLISFYIISEPRIRNRLRDELGVAMAGVPLGKLLQWTQLEKIPYLNACIKEGVRWVPLFPTDIQRRGKMCTDPQANRIGRTFRRNGRISPDQELQYKGYTIPKNVRPIKPYKMGCSPHWLTKVIIRHWYPCHCLCSMWTRLYSPSRTDSDPSDGLASTTHVWMITCSHSAKGRVTAWERSMKPPYPLCHHSLYLVEITCVLIRISSRAVLHARSFTSPLAPCSALAVLA